VSVRYSNQIFYEDVTPEVIAREMTLIDWEIFSSIKIEEFFNEAWSKPKLKHKSPNLLKLIGRFNDVSLWFASNILFHERLEKRAKQYTRTIQIAKELYRLNNFNSLMALIAGLNGAGVHRLGYTKGEVSKRELQFLAKMNQLMDGQGSFAQYRDAVKKCIPPVVPYIGVWLTDLTYISDGNPDETEGLINFHKRTLSYKVYSSIKYCQQTPYQIESSYNCRVHLEQLGFFDDDELYKLSLIREPRGVKSKDLIK